jgi:hypothetical protein
MPKCVAFCDPISRILFCDIVPTVIPYNIFKVSLSNLIHLDEETHLIRKKRAWSHVDPNWV